MAAFTPAAPEDWAGFAAHWHRLLSDPDVLKRAVLVDGAVAGHLLCFEQLGQRELSYWIDPAWRGQRVASSALAQFLAGIAERPLYARVIGTGRIRPSRAAPAETAGCARRGGATQASSRRISSPISLPRTAE